MNDETRIDKACTLTLDVTPETIHPTESISLLAKVTCAPARDLSGRTVTIRDEAGNEVGRVELTELDGTVAAAPPLSVTAPSAVGTFGWTAELAPEGAPEGAPGGAPEGASGEAPELVSEPIRIQVTPHATHVVVWGVPTGVPAGTRFPVHVGIRCASGDMLPGEAFRILDHDGTELATGRVGDEPWPGTTALTYATLELDAPAAEGSYAWRIHTEASDHVAPHEAGSASFRVKVTPRPECRVTVETSDQRTGEPLEGLHVLMHPFRAVTDEHGVAVLDVPKGSYAVHVSGRRYLPFDEPLDVVDDATVTAQLELESDGESVGL